MNIKTLTIAFLSLTTLAGCISGEDLLASALGGQVRSNNPNGQFPAEVTLPVEVHSDAAGNRFGHCQTVITTTEEATQTYGEHGRQIVVTCVMAMDQLLDISQEIGGVNIGAVTR